MSNFKLADDPGVFVPWVPPRDTLRGVVVALSELVPKIALPLTLSKAPGDEVPTPTLPLASTVRPEPAVELD